MSGSYTASAPATTFTACTRDRFTLYCLHAFVYACLHVCVCVCVCLSLSLCMNSQISPVKYGKTTLYIIFILFSVTWDHVKK
jgi:ABC-type sugar transport system permease subunit